MENLNPHKKTKNSENDVDKASGVCHNIIEVRLRGFG